MATKNYLTRAQEIAKELIAQKKAFSVDFDVMGDDVYISVKDFAIQKFENYENVRFFVNDEKEITIIVSDEEDDSHE